MIWTKASVTPTPDGGRVIRYAGESTDVAIESRRRMIPHATGSGGWMYTSYFVLKPGREELEYFTLKDAKRAAETMEREARQG